MKHAGSNADLKAQAEANPLPSQEILSEWRDPSLQSLASKLVLLASVLFLLAVVADGAVRSLALTLDPATRAALRVVTGFGNSAWPLGIGLLLLGLVALMRRLKAPAAEEDLAAFRAMLILLAGSVALSGFLASLTKHVIGRIRPSMPDAMVMEFSFMAFSSGWAAFPSGHATTATAAAVAMALCFPRHAWGWLAVGLLSALSRAFLGVHWLTDVVAGIGLGALVTVLMQQRMAKAGHRFELASGATPRVLRAALQMLRGLIFRRTSRPEKSMPSL